MKLNTLNKTSEFSEVKKLGKFISHKGFNGYYLRQELDSSNFFGIVVSKRIGNAVTRNYTKRRVREAIRTSEAIKTLKNLKLVLIMKKSVLDISFNHLKSDINTFLNLAHETN
ncbi:MAG: ribonuclease P protein component [Pelagibacteraceae bacterium]|nr:ribonuclease P protein component [Pelagibacteraceae bacterium]